jgi:hypothetical protein
MKKFELGKKIGIYRLVSNVFVIASFVVYVVACVFLFQSLHVSDVTWVTLAVREAVQLDVNVIAPVLFACGYVLLYFSSFFESRISKLYKKELEKVTGEG